MTSNSDIDSIYGRDALVLYLQDVRDLQVMYKMFEDKIMEGDTVLELNRIKYLTPSKVTIPKQSTASKVGSSIASAYLIYLLVMTALLTIGAILAFIISSGNPESIGIVGMNSPEFIGMVVTLVFIDIVLFKAISKRKAARSEAVENALRHNIEDDERLQRNKKAFFLKFEQPWAKKKAFLQNARKEIRGALDQDYALNIIPLQYRSLEAAIYLYNFMSTSRQPFAQALDHAQIDDGIRRIESKLNVIINQNEEQLRQLAQIKSNTDTLIHQGNAILAAQVATAYYASSAAAHARSIDAKMSNMQSYIQYGF